MLVTFWEKRWRHFTSNFLSISVKKLSRNIWNSSGFFRVQQQNTNKSSRINSGHLNRMRSCNAHWDKASFFVHKFIILNQKYEKSRIFNLIFGVKMKHFIDFWRENSNNNFNNLEGKFKYLPDFWRQNSKIS